MIITPANRYDRCFLCGHSRFLHSQLNGECEACDDPTIPLKLKCPAFLERPHELTAD